MLAVSSVKRGSRERLRDCPVWERLCYEEDAVACRGDAWTTMTGAVGGKKAAFAMGGEEADGGVR